MNVVTVTPSASYPVSLASVKQFLDLRHDENDAVLDEVVRASVSIVEQTLEMVLVTRTLELRLDDWPRDRRIDLPYAPLQSVSSVKYTAAGIEKTIDPANYSVVLAGQGLGAVVAKFGYVWPSVDEEPEVVRIRYVVGFGSDPSSIPPSLSTAVKETAHRVFDSRGAIDLDGVKRSILSIAADYKTWRF